MKKNTNIYVYENQRVYTLTPLNDGKSISGRLLKDGNNIDFTPAIRHGENPLVAETEHFRCRKCKTGYRITGTLADLASVNAVELAKEIKIIVKTAEA